jgi:hypothetical protein
MKNDETRMAKDEGMTKLAIPTGKLSKAPGRIGVASGFVIGNSFVFRPSSFVIS